MAANLASAQADALRDAANNPNGAAMAMMGVNMVGNGTANTIQAALSQAQTNNNQALAATTWTCSCGTTNSGNFCTNCGKPKNAKKVCPTCQKEVEADSKFCPYCGAQL
jgi:Putative virion core protein (lumpy skin disease virus)